MGDSFDRLIHNGHKARMEILANERQRYPGARITDEVHLFMFSVQPTVIANFELDHDLLEFDLSPVIDRKRVVADAKKAFISLLRPEYNTVKFTSYPKGADGLYGSEYVTYNYVIGEDVAFNTAHGRIRGARIFKQHDISKGIDMISVEGETVRLHSSGV